MAGNSKGGISCRSKNQPKRPAGNALTGSRRLHNLCAMPCRGKGGISNRTKNPGNEPTASGSVVFTPCACWCIRQHPPRAKAEFRVAKAESRVARAEFRVANRSQDVLFAMVSGIGPCVKPVNTTGSSPPPATAGRPCYKGPRPPDREGRGATTWEMIEPDRGGTGT